MKRRLILYLTHLLALFLLTACIETEIAPWNNNPIPVVFSVISPDKPVQVYLGKSYSESSINFPSHIEARIFVSDNNNNDWYELERSTIDSLLFRDAKSLFKIEAAKQYFLKVELSSITLHAETTVPNQQAEVDLVDCVVNSTDSTSGIALCSINVRYSLPADKNFGCFLEAFGSELGTAPELTGGFYQDDYFFIPIDSLNFKLKIITVDPFLNKFRIAKNISITQFHDKVDVNALISTYGGVRPNFSNIKNGMGLFGSYVSNTNNVTTKTKDE